MYLISRYGGRCRSIYTRIDDGVINVRNGRDHVHVKVRNGIAVEEMTEKNGKCTILRYGRDLTVKMGKRIIWQEFFEPNTLRSLKKGGLWKKQYGISLCGTKGTLECYSTSNGAFGREIFTYDNGIKCYCAARWQKKLVVHRPDGKLWMVIKGSKVHVSRYSIVEQLAKKNGNIDVWRFMDGQNWDMTVYDTDGTTAVTQGSFKASQKEGKWLENGRTRYYMSGVKVSRSLYEENPKKWNPHELLRVPNAQLRCSLLSKFGYDKLLAKVESKVLDSSYDGGQLLEITAEKTPDKTMHLIKVICPSTGQVYVLRVPPEMKKFEQARQWTFGLRQESIMKGSLLDLVKET